MEYQIIFGYKGKDEKLTRTIELRESDKERTVCGKHYEDTELQVSFSNSSSVFRELEKEFEMEKKNAVSFSLVCEDCFKFIQEKASQETGERVQYSHSLELK